MLSCANFCQAEDSTKNLSPQTTTNQTVIQSPVDSKVSTPAVLDSIQQKELTPVASKSQKVTDSVNPPKLTTPVVQDSKVQNVPPSSKKVDLRAVIFDPNAQIDAAAKEEGREMTKTEKAEYDVNKALHGQVSALTTKGLLEDKMRIKFEKGPVESIAPWVDFNGMFTNAWSGDNYANTLYGVNFNDVGINGKFRDGKTVFRVMYNVGKEISGNTYLQSFMADNYIMRNVTKTDQVLIGYARAAVGVEGGESPFTIPFFTRSQISRTYGNVRTLGIKAQGQHKYYDYSLGGFSSGRFFKDFFPGAEFTGLVSIKPLAFTDGKWGKIVAGGSLNAGNAESHYVVGGAHLIYEYKRLKASFEYASADGSNGSTGFTSNRSEGFYGTLAYRVTPKLQIVTRYDQFDPNKDARNDRRTEYTAGINYFIKEQALKLMVNYVYYTLENGGFGSRILVGTQIIL